MKRLGRGRLVIEEKREDRRGEKGKNRVSGEKRLRIGRLVKGKEETRLERREKRKDRVSGEIG